MLYTPYSAIWDIRRYAPPNSIAIARKNIANLSADGGNNNELARNKDNALTKALKGVTANNKVSESIKSRIDFLLQYRWDALKGSTSTESKALIGFINGSIAVKMISDRAINHYLEPLEQIIDTPE